MRRQRSMVKMVLELLKIEVRELMMADSITAISSPRAPVGKKEWITDEITEYAPGNLLWSIYSAKL